MDALSAAQYSVSLEPATHHACPHPIASLVRAADKALSTLRGFRVLRVSEWGFLSVPAFSPRLSHSALNSYRMLCILI